MLFVGLKKMNPMTVRIYDTQKEVGLRFLDMGTTTGVDSAKAQTIFDKMDEVMVENEIPWDQCVAIGVDNAAVNVGNRNSIKTRVLKKNPAIHFVGCPCHACHNTGQKASIAFRKVNYNYFICKFISINCLFVSSLLFALLSLYGNKLFHSRKQSSTLMTLLLM